MSRKIETAKSGRDFVAIGKRSPNLLHDRYSGDHWTGTTEQGRVTVADNNRELKPWLRRKIMLEFIAIGLASVVLVFALRVMGA